MVHLRYTKWGGGRGYFDEEELKSPNEVSWDVQRFANAFFIYLEQNNVCSEMRAMIFGMHWAPDRSNDERIGVESCYPRYCFIKGYRIDALNRKIVTAVPVPAHQIRELEPECNLLDFDPECEWVGGMPGRLHEF